MKSRAKLFLTAALCVFAIFSVNIVLGAFWNARFLSDVGEMLMLVLTSIFFVVAIILFEQNEQDPTNQQ